MADRRFAMALVGGLAIGAVLVAVLPPFFRWIGSVPGTMPPDLLLPHYGPIDVSTATFAVLYGTVLLVLASMANRPLRVLHGLYAYALMVLLRMVAMAAITLEPPPDIIPLVDPVTRMFYPAGAPFLKDLFFSGHTATLALMALLAPKGPVRWMAAAGTLAVGALVLVQHVHWTVDVLAALPAAWLAWWLAGQLLRCWGLGPGAAGA